MKVYNQISTILIVPYTYHQYHYLYIDSYIMCWGSCAFLNLVAYSKSFKMKVYYQNSNIQNSSLSLLFIFNLIPLSQNTRLSTFYIFPVKLEYSTGHVFTIKLIVKYGQRWNSTRLQVKLLFLQQTIQLQQLLSSVGTSMKLMFVLLWSFLK